MNKRCGFTLVESLMGVSLLAIATVAIALPLMASYQQQREADEMAAAGSLAKQLLDEIAAKPFVDPNLTTLTLGPDTGETVRQHFDNIDDYNGYTDGTGGLTTVEGDPVATVGVVDRAYTRTVRAEYRASPGGSAAASGDFIMVSVLVRTPSGQQLTAERLFTKYTKK